MANRKDKAKEKAMLSPPAVSVRKTAGGESIALSKDTLNALKNGDHEAFEKIFLLYFDKIRHFINLILHSSEEAEELAQDVFCTIWEKREKIDPSKNFSTYMYVSARNAVYDYIRRRKVREDYTKITWDVNMELPEAEEKIIAGETQLLIDMVVGKMPYQRRKVFEMSRYEHLSNDRIAELLGISRNAVEKQLRLALSDIRKVIAALVAILHIS